MKTYLLIGGPEDGQRIELPEFQDQLLIRAAAPQEKLDKPPEIQEFNYRAHHIWAGSNPVTVFVYGNMSLLDILTKLVEGYHRV